MNSAAVFFAGAFGIGLGGGLFAVATLMAAMTLPAQGLAGRGLALGAWGAAQATAAGVAIFVGGALRDLVQSTEWAQSLGAATGYSTIYHIEIAFLFLTLIALGPLVRTTPLARTQTQQTGKIGLADLPT